MVPAVAEAAGMKIEVRLGCRFATDGWHMPFSSR
jgi:hypothetical protein